MPVGKGPRGPLWVDGQFTARVRGPGPEPGRIVRIRRPFALIGQIPGADIRIDDPDVDGRHALLLLDRRGIFGVDLRSQSGTRFAGASLAASWLGTGDILEIAARRIELLQLRIDGVNVDPPLSIDDPLADSPGLVGLTLEPLDDGGPPWMLGSALAFIGRGEACAIRIENASASMTHAALFRDAQSAYVIDLLGRRTLVNDQAFEGASMLVDGDTLTIGQARFSVKIEYAHKTLIESRPATILARIADALPREASIDPALRSQGAMIAMLLNAAQSNRDTSNFEVIDVLRQFQADTATLLEAQIDRIESLNREIASLREEVQGRRGPYLPPAEPLRLDLIPPAPAPSDESAGWLLDRINTLETETRSTWKDLLGKITSTVAPRTAPASSQELARNDTGNEFPD